MIKKVINFPKKSEQEKSIESFLYDLVSVLKEHGVAINTRDEMHMYFIPKEQGDYENLLESISFRVHYPILLRDPSFGGWTVSYSTKKVTELKVD